MTFGRNQPCYCGSGKKYKKCCLANHEAAKRTDPEPAAGPAGPRGNPDSESVWARSKELGPEGYEARLNHVAQTIDGPDPLDGETVFYMLDELFGESCARGERDRFDALIAKLRDRRPEIYIEDAPFFLSWQIKNAVAAGRSEGVSNLALELAPLAGRQIDVFNRTESLLAYHGYLSILVEMTRVAWPSVESSNNVVPWAIDEFRSRAVTYQVLDRAARAGDANAADPELLGRLGFWDVNVSDLAAYCSHLAGRAGRRWVMSDFQLAAPQEQPGDEDEEGGAPSGSSAGERNLFHLTNEFLGHLGRVEGVPWTKGELGRRELHRFLLARHAGRLEYRESMLRSAQRDLDRRHGKKPAPAKKFRSYPHPLVPDGERLDRYLAELLDMFNYRRHAAAALLEIVPSWLRFLTARGLTDANTQTQSLSELGGLADRLARILDDGSGDPAPRLAMQDWRRIAVPIEPPGRDARRENPVQETDNDGR